jgi:hypothetical protein
VALSPAFAKVLAAGRAQFNARVAEAGRRHPGLDTAAFGRFLGSHVDGIVAAVAGVAPERAAAVSVVAFDVALDLVAQGWVGPAAREASVNEVWLSLAPRYPRLIADDPLAVLGALTNAAIHLTTFPSARPREWMELLTACASRIESIAQLKAVGQVAAWRAGLAHYRESALRVADSLPEPLALAALGISQGVRWGQVRVSVAANRWWIPGEGNAERQQRRIEVGRFSGLGGTFASPPEVRASEEGFLVRSADRHHLLIADAYGAVLLPATGEEFMQAAYRSAAPEPPRLNGTALEISGVEVPLDLPAEGVGLAYNDHTVAVTSPYTFAIRLIPRT